MLDRCHRIAYACRSPRTTALALADFATRLGYRAVAFDALGPDAGAYHTNVLMAIGERFAVLCDEAIADPHERAAVLRELRDAGTSQSASASRDNGFAGNLLALWLQTAAR